MTDTPIKVSDYDRGFIHGLVYKYGREVVIEVANEDALLADNEEVDELP